MIIRHNISAMNSNRIIANTNSSLFKSAEKLASGYRINKAGDDAAGLAISEKMRAQVRGLSRAAKNTLDGISLIQTAEGALQEVHNILQRINELAVQSATDTNVLLDRENLNAEVRQLISEVDGIAATTRFNDVILLNGELQQTPATTVNTNPKIQLPFNMDMISFQAVIASQTPMYTTTGGTPELKNLLKNEIVPNAVKAILDAFPDTFGYLKGSQIGIGLEFENNYDSTVLAAVKSNTFLGRMFYTLSINTAYYSATDAGRTELERTVSHEMMHALMAEALTSGMVGVDKDDNSVTPFPMWFIEGTAQLISGAFEDNSNWINVGLGLDKNHSLSDITMRLNLYKLGGGTSQAEYGTGYLAVMYLGHIISGSSTFDPASIAHGVDVLINTVRGGTSLDTAVKDLTQYNGINDFVNKFATDGASFVSQLLNSVGTGTGSLLTGKFNETDLLDNGANTDTSISGLFALNTSSTMVLNDYSGDPSHVMIEGGALTSSGIAGQDYVPSTIGGNVNPPAPPVDPPGGGNGGDGGDPDSGDPDGSGGTGTVTPPAGGGGDGSGTTQPVTPPAGGGGTGGGTGGGGTGGGTINGGSNVGGIHLQTGAESGNSTSIFIASMNANGLGINNVNISTRNGAVAAITTSRNALNTVSAQRSELGSIQNRLEHKYENLSNTVENLSAAESHIRDVDMAEEMNRMTKFRIIQQAGYAVLAQANTLTNNVLSLLKA